MCKKKRNIIGKEYTEEEKEKRRGETKRGSKEEKEQRGKIKRKEESWGLRAEVHPIRERNLQKGFQQETYVVPIVQYELFLTKKKSINNKENLNCIMVEIY